MPDDLARYRNRLLERTKIYGVRRIPAAVLDTLSIERNDDLYAMLDDVVFKMTAEVFRERVKTEVEEAAWSRDVEVTVPRRSRAGVVAASSWAVAIAGVVDASVVLFVIGCALALLAVVAHAYPGTTTEVVTVEGTVAVPVGVYAVLPDYVAPRGMNHVVFPQLEEPDVYWRQA